MSSLESSSSPSTTLQGFYGWTDTLKGVYYGPGSVATALPKLLKTIGGTKALIVTGKSLYQKTDVVKRVEQVLQAYGAYGATFYEIGEHTPIAGIRKGIQIFNDNKCDIIVSVGGGSPVDGSKAILFNIQKETGGPTLRQIAIPTTLSAAEYTIGAGFTNDDGQKVAVTSQELAPAGIILDAELTLDTPERLWLSTGIRSLDHAIENLYRPMVIPPVKILCYAAITDLFKYLPLSKANPKDIVARQKLQLASWMSLWPMKLEKYSALGLSHALGHKLGARYGIPHGITSASIDCTMYICGNCITLAPTVALKADIASQEDKEYLAGALFHLRQPSTESLDGDVRLLAKLIQQLVIDLGVQSDLTEYNIPKEDLEGIASSALGTQDDGSIVVGKVVEMLETLYSIPKL
ncbi:alcohol dehydrogenase IV [Crucibulum laeve]|uniref:Alcohol dehydrogenase IV n=1 Tax=Crucibulum laeve TaxID=68775 RepID=A0A5C3MLF6_9AGAR|nr:alcohol dehydrogenase IV [Crucibulum laeve]